MEVHQSLDREISGASKEAPFFSHAQDTAMAASAGFHFAGSAQRNPVTPVTLSSRMIVLAGATRGGADHSIV